MIAQFNEAIRYRIVQIGIVAVRKQLHGGVDDVDMVRYKRRCEIKEGLQALLTQKRAVHITFPSSIAQRDILQKGKYIAKGLLRVHDTYCSTNIICDITDVDHGILSTIALN